MANWEKNAQVTPQGLVVPKKGLTPKEVSDYQRAHVNADTDFDSSAIHHTLGTGPFQAASGSHDHANGPQRLIANSDSRGNTDFNSKIQNGWYVMDSVAANNPLPGAVFLLEVRAYFSYVHQTATHVVTGAKYRRIYSPNAWGPWNAEVSQTNFTWDINVNPDDFSTQIHRDGNMVNFYFNFSVKINWSSAWSFGNVPVGFRPIMHNIFAGFNGTTGGVGALVVYTSGALHMYQSLPSAGQYVQGSITYRVA